MKNGKDVKRLWVKVHGAVQGVGFRPFVYRLATELGLSGWVNNSSQGVFIEVEGPSQRVETFLKRLSSDKPPPALIQRIEHEFKTATGFKTFDIQKSDGSGQKTAFILPDLATCDDCISEIFDPKNRRHRYPFTNCTNCGPRFSIIEALPYDRPNTTMKVFPMCKRCLAEYEDPLDRRFHAQPNACPDCGPQLQLWDQRGNALADRENALLRAAEAINDGKIVALKGLGGFHLIVDARNEAAVLQLRGRKHRDEKPLAMMYPSFDRVLEHCHVNEAEAELLQSAQAPIVLLHHKGKGRHEIAAAVAPGNPYWGIMLPYTPLHHLLMAELDFSVVATSGNLSDEPICIDEREALRRLSSIADLFLIHNRPIARHVDDSVVRLIADRPSMVRRARGYAPLPIALHQEKAPSVLAVGAHLKNTVALSLNSNAFISQHIGDLETRETYEAFQKVIADFQALYDARPQRVVCDMHPDYLSTQFSKQMNLPITSVQHHYAHVLACRAEHDLKPPVLGVAWDGTGYGPDGTVWGGEFLYVDEGGFERVGHLHPFKLPGGETAVKEPRRTALGVLYEVFGEALFEGAWVFELEFSARELTLLKEMLVKDLNAPLTSSMGRLFDAIAALTKLHLRCRFEGQAAMALEFALEGVDEGGHYDVELRQTDSKILLDWRPMIRQMLDDLHKKTSVGCISAKFHHTLVEMIVAMAHHVGERHVVLTGGCFQNKYLSERAIARLWEEGFTPYWHQQVPANDGGLALGQIVAGWTACAKG